MNNTNLIYGIQDKPKTLVRKKNGCETKKGICLD